MCGRGPSTLSGVVTAQDFFTLVDRHLTTPMLEAHYVKIGEYDVVRSSPAAGLLSSGRAGPGRSRVSSWLQERRRGPEVAAFEVGFERSSDGDEEWICYYPGTRELDLISWRDVLGGHADWDVWHDRMVPDEAELERRLVVLCAAIRAGESDRPSP